MNLRMLKNGRHFRMLNKADFDEFKRAAVESVESNYEYLRFGEFFDSATLVEMLNEFARLLNDVNTDHYGLFEFGKLLGHVGITRSSSPYGVELYGWVRRGYHSQGIGELGLQTGAELAFEHKGFNFVELNIDQSNSPSRRVAEKAGFVSLYKTWNAPEPFGKIFVNYIKFSPRIIKLAERYSRTPLEIMNCPAANASYMNYLLRSESLIEFYAWPFPRFHEEMTPIDKMEYHTYMSLVNLTPSDIAFMRQGPNDEAAVIGGEIP